MDEFDNGYDSWHERYAFEARQLKFTSRDEAFSFPMAHHKNAVFPEGEPVRVEPDIPQQFSSQLASSFTKEITQSLGMDMSSDEKQTIGSVSAPATPTLVPAPEPKPVAQQPIPSLSLALAPALPLPQPSPAELLAELTKFARAQDHIKVAEQCWKNRALLPLWLQRKEIDQHTACAIVAMQHIIRMEETRKCCDENEAETIIRYCHESPAFMQSHTLNDMHLLLDHHPTNFKQKHTLTFHIFEAWSYLKTLATLNDCLGFAINLTNPTAAQLLIVRVIPLSTNQISSPFWSILAEVVRSQFHIDATHKLRDFITPASPELITKFTEWLTHHFKASPTLLTRKEEKEETEVKKAPSPTPSACCFGLTLFAASTSPTAKKVAAAYCNECPVCKEVVDFRRSERILVNSANSHNQYTVPGDIICYACSPPQAYHFKCLKQHSAYIALYRSMLPQACDASSTHKVGKKPKCYDLEVPPKVLCLCPKQQCYRPEIVADPIMAMDALLFLESVRVQKMGTNELKQLNAKYNLSSDFNLKDALLSGLALQSCCGPVASVSAKGGTVTFTRCTISASEHIAAPIVATCAKCFAVFHRHCLIMSKRYWPKLAPDIYFFCSSCLGDAKSVDDKCSVPGCKNHTNATGRQDSARSCETCGVRVCGVCPASRHRMSCSNPKCGGREYKETKLLREIAQRASPVQQCMKCQTRVVVKSAKFVYVFDTGAMGFTCTECSI